MRVSFLFNSIAAPLLYRSVVLDGKSGLFDHCDPDEMTKGRKTQSKDGNLAYIEVVDYMSHAHDKCRNRSLPERSISVPILVARTAYVTGNFLFCDCSRILTPYKLVYPKASFYWREAPSRTVEVAILRSEQYMPGFATRPSPTTASKLVFVFWSSPNQPQAWSFEFWRSIRDVFLNLSTDPHYPKDITIVNIESAVSQHLQSDENRDRSPCEIAAEDTRKRYLLWITRMEKFVPQNAFLNEIRSAKFTFDTMKDYLANYDWEGEFTDEEVRQWLEHRE
jgi:hypothetical protein